MTSLRKTLDTTDFCKSRVRCAQLTGHWRTGGANLRTFLSGEARLNRYLAMPPPATSVTCLLQKTHSDCYSQGITLSTLGNELALGRPLMSDIRSDFRVSA